MAIAKISTEYVPYVFAVSVDRTLVGERERTAGGKLRQDAIAIKRAWSLQTRPLTFAEASALTNIIDGGLGGPFAFWIDDFGAETNTVQAFVTIEDEERVAFAKGGTWHNNGRQLTLLVEEQ